MTPTHAAASRHDGHAGFTVVEVVMALAILTVIAGTMFDGMLRLTRTNTTVSNRTVVHSGVRNATELLQQEVGQAGLITLPQRVRLASAVAPGSVTVNFTRPAGVTVTRVSVLYTWLCAGSQRGVSVHATPAPGAGSVLLDCAGAGGSCGCPWGVARRCPAGG